jgi:hypothetical protein
MRNIEVLLCDTRSVSSKISANTFARIHRSRGQSLPLIISSCPGRPVRRSRALADIAERHRRLSGCDIRLIRIILPPGFRVMARPLIRDDTVMASIKINSFGVYCSCTRLSVTLRSDLLFNSYCPFGVRQCIREQTPPPLRLLLISHVASGGFAELTYLALRS